MFIFTRGYCSVFFTSRQVWNKFISLTVFCCDSGWLVILSWICLTWFCVFFILNWRLDNSSVSCYIVNSYWSSFFVDISHFCCTFYNCSSFVWTCLNFFVVINCTIFSSDLSWFVICCVVVCSCWSCLRIHYLRSNYFTCSVYIVNNNWTLNFFVNVCYFSYTWNNIACCRTLSKGWNKFVCLTISSCDSSWLNISCIVWSTCWSFWSVCYRCLDNCTISCYIVNNYWTFHFFVDISYFCCLTCFNCTFFSTDCSCWDQLVSLTVFCCDSSWFVVCCVVVRTWLCVCFIIHRLLDYCTIFSDIVNNYITSLFINVLNSCCCFCYFTSCWCRRIFHFFVVVNCAICCCDSFWTVVFICVVDSTNRLVVFIHHSCCDDFTSCVVVFYNDVRLNFFVDVSYFCCLTSFNITYFATDCCCWNKFVDFTISCCDGFWFVISCVVLSTWFLICFIVNRIFDNCTICQCVVHDNVTSLLVNVSDFCCTFYDFSSFSSWSCVYFFVVVNCTIFSCDLSWLVVCCIVSCTCWSRLRIHYLWSNDFASSVYIVNNNITLHFFVHISYLSYTWNNFTCFRTFSKAWNKFVCLTIWSCDGVWTKVSCIVLSTCWSFWCVCNRGLDNCAISCYIVNNYWTFHFFVDISYFFSFTCFYSTCFITNCRCWN